jgi:hypothetical protein
MEKKIEKLMSQVRYFYNAFHKIVEADQTFLDIMEGPNPITKEEYNKLVSKRPELWGRYHGFFYKEQP